MSASLYFLQPRRRPSGFRIAPSHRGQHIPRPSDRPRDPARSSPNGRRRFSPLSDDRLSQVYSGSRRLLNPEKQSHGGRPVSDNAPDSPRLKGNSGMKQAGTIEICPSMDAPASARGFREGEEKNSG